MNKLVGRLILRLEGAMYSRAAAEDVVNALLLNGYTVTLKQLNNRLYVDYEIETEN